MIASLLPLVAPSTLETALERASHALSENVCGYTIAFPETEEHEYSAINYWSWQQEANARYDVGANGGPILKIVKTHSQIFAANYLEKAYAITPEVGVWNEIVPEGRLRPEPGHWLFFFSPNRRLILRASPEFTITDDKNDLWEGKKVRSISFISKRKGTETFTKGSAQFDAQTQRLVHADIESNSEESGKYTVDYVDFTQSDIPPSVFSIDLSDFKGFKKVIDPPTEF